MNRHPPSILFGMLSIAMLCLILGFTARAGSHPDVIEDVGSGRINWTRGVLEAHGIHDLSENSDSNLADRFVGLAEAERKARTNLMETAAAVRLNSRLTVADAMARSQALFSEIEAAVRRDPQVHRRCLADGTVEVSVWMPLYGGFSRAVLPQEIRTIEPLQKVSPPNPPASPSVKPHEPAIRTAFTGLVVDARGLRVKPALVIRVTDETGEEVYGSAFVSRESAVENGMVRYVRDPASAGCLPEAARHPLVVRALRTHGLDSPDLVISNADAARLREYSDHLEFLKKSQVMILVDER